MRYGITVALILLNFGLFSSITATKSSYLGYVSNSIQTELLAIKTFEGFSSIPYKDGQTTSIGYGFYQRYHLKNVDTLSREQADKYFIKVTDQIQNKVLLSYPPHKAAKIIHLYYWLGEKGAKQYIDSTGNLKDSLLLSNFGRYKKRIAWILKQQTAN